jgi:hypothetical protein
VNLIRGNSIFVLAVWFTAAAILLPLPGRAQEVIRGQFRLSQEVLWEDAVLPMGDYDFFVEPNRWPFAVRVEQLGGGFSGMFIPEDVLRPGRQGHTGIVVGRMGNDTYVMSLRLQELGEELDFSAPVTEMEKRPGDSIDGDESGAPAPQAAKYVTIINPNHERISPEEAERVYLRACEVVEQQFNARAPIRPRVILRLGSNGNVLRFPMLEIHLKKWDQYRFADAVVELAIHNQNKVTPEQRVRLGNAAVNEAGATINICELKACRN